MSTHIVIMAGGIGSRFWPMSTPEYPKQFIDVLGCGKSLIQLMVGRFEGICPVENIWIVTSEKYLDIVQEQLPEVPRQNILLEPVARNTAPCIAYACWKIKAWHSEANIVVTPADALVLDTQEFRRVIGKALEFTERNESIVTIGIQPNRPETGYGYISGAEAGEIPAGFLKVDEFKEKPDLATAQKYVAAGTYYWNAGIFVWRMDVIEKALRRFVPQISAVFDEIAPSFYGKEEEAVIKSKFPLCDRISIDYAVMEKAENIYVLPAEFGWSDLGSWGALCSLLPKDESGNAVVAKDIKLYDCKDCIVHAPSLERIVLQGLDGYIIAERNKVLLICKLVEEQRIKEFVV